MKIILDGTPIAQGRPRLSKWGVFDPNSNDKKRVKLQLAANVKRLDNGFQFLQHPRISFVFHMPIPSGIPKWQKTLRESGIEKHTKKPDVDNLIKFYMDCLDGIAFEGDQKVTLGACVKLYHTNPKTIIWIDETTNVLNHWEVDPMIWIDRDVIRSGILNCVGTDSLPDLYIPQHLLNSQSDDKKDLDQTD